MEHVTQEMERLIVRRLDGALTEDEALRLDRELIRNPDARRLLEDYVRVDAVASAALREVMVGADQPVDMSVLTSGPPQRGWSARYHRGWWLLPGAVAAALLALMIPKSGLDRAGSPAPGGTAPLVQRAPAPLSESPLNPTLASGRERSALAARPRRGSGLMHHASHRPTMRRHTGREVLGVMGDDGAIYWIEVDRTRTVRHAPVRRRLGVSDRL